MTLDITRQDSYARGELLLRSFFGWLYILIPHAFMMFFASIWSGILSFIAWWVVLFTGRYPESFFEFQVKMQSWSLRFSASVYNLVDGYPGIGPNGSHPGVSLEIPYPASLSRGKLLLRIFFGWLYILIPHVFCLYFRMLVTGIFSFIAWWAVLFTGSYPEGMHSFNVGTLRWSTRLGIYWGFMTDDYPPFSGKP